MVEETYLVAILPTPMSREELVPSRWNATVRYQAYQWPRDALVLHAEQLPALEPRPAEAVSYARFQQAPFVDEHTEDIISARLRYSRLQDLHPEPLSSSRDDELLDRCARRAAARKKLRREELLRSVNFSSDSPASSPDCANRHFPALRPSGLHCRSAQAYEIAPKQKPQKYSDLILLCREKDRATQGRAAALR